jgi:hypothetical protein
MWKDAASNTNHPQKLVDVITPKTTRTYFTSKELKISHAAFSGDDIAVPTVAM